jgi:hypothetical protein
MSVSRAVGSPARRAAKVSTSQFQLTTKNEIGSLSGKSISF